MTMEKEQIVNKRNTMRVILTLSHTSQSIKYKSNKKPGRKYKKMYTYSENETLYTRPKCLITQKATKKILEGYNKII